MNQVRKGRPPKPEAEKAVRKKYPTPLQVRLSSNLEESERLKALYASRMGRDHLIGLLELPESDWQEVLEVLSRHWDGEHRK